MNSTFVASYKEAKRACKFIVSPLRSLFVDLLKANS